MYKAVSYTHLLCYLLLLQFRIFFLTPDARFTEKYQNHQRYVSKLIRKNEVKKEHLSKNNYEKRVIKDVYKRQDNLHTNFRPVSPRYTLLQSLHFNL